MNVINYQRELDALLKNIQENQWENCQDTRYENQQDTRQENIRNSQEKKEGCRPSLFLHSCCAPCSSYVLEYLSEYFRITDFFYNPNIWPPQEYDKRVSELERLIHQMPLKGQVSFVTGRYVPAEFFSAVKGLENIPEGGERCFACYALRMEETARMAAEGGYDYFTTTLSISPLKNAAKINEIGRRLEEKYGVRHLPSDFKKRGGYQRSIQLSREYSLYRQDYCGCIFSQKERNERVSRRDDSEKSGG